LILHGAGSAPANHADFAEAARTHGFDPVTPELPGHGEASPLDEGILHWVSGCLEAGTVLRGGSLGAFVSLHAAAADDRVPARVAIAPTTEPLVLERYPQWPVRVDGPSFEAWLRGRDIFESVLWIGCPVLYVHARDDEQIPVSVSERLHAATPRSELVVLDSGGH